MSEQMEQQEQTAKKQKKGKEKVKKTVGQEILSWVLTIVVAVIAALLIRSFIFEPVRVDGHSMDDTLADGEIMFVSKFDYSSTWLSLPDFMQSKGAQEDAPRFTFGGNPQRFDVVICRYPGRGATNFVKRVIGLPGDTLALDNGQLTVNGEAYEEPYVSDDYRTGSLNNMREFQVPAKGDPMKYENGYIWVNGQIWPYAGTRLSGKSDDGSRLEYKYATDEGKLKLLLNGKELETEEDYKAVEGVEYKLENDYFFVMGDHRNNSNDSRSQGPIERSMIVGHVRCVLYPFNQWRDVKNGLDEAAK